MILNGFCKNVIILITLGLLSFYQCTSLTEEVPIVLPLSSSEVKLYDQQKFENDSALSIINKLLDTASIYLITDPLKNQQFIDKALLFAAENDLWSKHIEAHNYQLSHFIYYNKPQEWKRELLVIDSLISLYKDELGSEASILSNTNKTQWGMYYSHIGFPQKSITILRNVIDNLESLPLDSATTYSLYYNSIWLASFYKKTNSFEASIQENQRALLLLEQYKKSISVPSKITKTPIYGSIADAYLSLEDTINSFLYFQKARKELEKNPESPSTISHTLQIYSSLSKYYNHTKQYDLSLASLQKIESYLQPNDPFYPRNLMSIGDIYLHQKNYEASRKAYSEVKKVYFSPHGTKNYSIANANLKIAHLYKVQNKWTEALSFYQQAIGNVVLNFGDTLNYRTNPDKIDINQIIGKIELLKALDGKTSVLKKLYEQKEDINFLKTAQQTNDLAIALIDSIKDDLFLDKDRQFQVEDHYPIYEKGIDLAAKLHLLTGEAYQQEKALMLSERSKSLGLLAIFRSNPGENRELAGLIEREKQFNYEIAKRTQALINKTTPFNEDSLYISLQYRRNQWLETVRKGYPNYLKFRYEVKPLPLKAIQKNLLLSKQVLLEYFWGEEYLYTFAIDAHEINIHKQEIVSLSDSIGLLRNLALDPSWRSKIDAGKHFQELSYFLYKKLVAEPLRKLNAKHTKLLLVRDGLLEYIPFELLDVSQETSLGIFLQEDFLLSHYSVAYANSLTLLELQQKQKKRKAKRLFAGFAPSYKGTFDVTDNSPLVELARPRQIELKENKQEIASIVETIGGDIFIGKEASELIFKEKAADYKILHLAMHALANDQRPELSQLLFTELGTNQAEDGQLRAIELYNMELKAEMAVLSACGTGYGKLLRGEGVLSLSHAFTYAGVPSIIASQWNANDASTAVIMTNFYFNLKNGMSKDEALTLAKINFLKTNPTQAHPFYWATFVATGDMTPIEFSSPILTYTLLVFAILLILGFIYWRKSA